MDIQEQQEFGEVIREQGQNQGHCMKDLVFDPVSGDFVLVDKGSAHEGDIVTEMTEKGFAYWWIIKCQSYI